MSSIIKMTPEYMQEIMKEFVEAMKKIRVSDGKLTYTKTFDKKNEKATLRISELAYFKMYTLVQKYDSEIAWHGLAKRGDDPEKNEYKIEDIIVYPQEVTGATVTTDQEKYQTWLYQNPDEVFNNIRMQGHSHVNMGVTPSGVDRTLYDGILGQLTDDMFYIFLIMNKKEDYHIEIYDMAKNILFETKDVDVIIQDDGIGLQAILDSARNMVQTRSISVNKPVGTANKNSSVTYSDQDFYDDYDYDYYGGYGRYGYSVQSTGKKKKKKSSVQSTKFYRD